MSLPFRSGLALILLSMTAQPLAQSAGQQLDAAEAATRALGDEAISGTGDAFDSVDDLRDEDFGGPLGPAGDADPAGGARDELRLEEDFVITNGGNGLPECLPELDDKISTKERSGKDCKSESESGADRVRPAKSQ